MQGWIQSVVASTFSCVACEVSAYIVVGALFSPSSGAQGMSSTATAHPFLSPVAKFSGEGGEWEGQTATIFTLVLQSHMKAKVLARLCPNQLVSSEHTAHAKL